MLACFILGINIIMNKLLFLGKSKISQNNQVSYHNPNAIPPTGPRFGVQVWGVIGRGPLHVPGLRDAVVRKALPVRERGGSPSPSPQVPKSPRPLCHIPTPRRAGEMRAEWSRFGGDGGRSGGSLEEHERHDPQLSAFNYNYPLSLLPVWLMRGGSFFPPPSAPPPSLPWN